MYLGLVVVGGHLLLGLSVRGTHGPRTSCLGGGGGGGGRHFRGGDLSYYDTNIGLVKGGQKDLIIEYPSFTCSCFLSCS